MKLDEPQSPVMLEIDAAMLRSELEAEWLRECLRIESKAREGREALLRENEALRAQLNEQKAITEDWRATAHEIRKQLLTIDF